MISILMIDDHSLVREGVKRILGEVSDMEITGQASSYEQALGELSKHAYDVVLLDISLPGNNGIEVLKGIKREWPRMPVLMLTVHSEEEYAVRSFKAGASGYLTKDSEPQKLIGAIRTLSKGGRHISSLTAELLAVRLEDNQRNRPHELLSDREYQVFCHLGKGTSLKEISLAMSLKVSTLSTYRRRILNKMGLKSNAEITRYAIQNQLIS